MSNISESEIVVAVTYGARVVLQRKYGEHCCCKVVCGQQRGHAVWHRGATLAY